MGVPLRILIVEDSEDDVLLLIRELRRAGYDPTWTRVDTADALAEALHSDAWDIVVSDYRMPRFDAPSALAVVQQANLDIPFIIVSGTIGEELAVEAMRLGADDYIMKDNLTRLVPAIERELKESADRREARENLRKWQRGWEDIFQSIGDPTIITDLDSRVTAANRAVAEALRMPLDQIVGRKCCELMHGTADSPDWCPRVQALETKRRSSSKGLIEALGGTYMVTCTPVLDHSGRVERVIEIATDISNLIAAERKLEESLERLREVLMGTVNAMALTAEVRDPYTAGHQRRVSRLACMIAGAMGMDEDRITGLRVAGLLHDIGKISIPAEILHKPGKLDPYEMGIIRNHTRVGYEILKPINFPWPVGEIVLQHHERLNGSGYPGMLRGDEILPEARILAVADVVEAMSSHRPYRPALGLAASLAEISNGRGVLYDPEAVEACREILSKEQNLRDLGIGDSAQTDGSGRIWVYAADMAR